MNSQQAVFFSDLGEIEYGAAWDFQEKLLQENLAAKAQWHTHNDGPYAAKTKHHLLFCTHPAVYTLGKSGKPEHLLANEEEREQLHVSFYKTNRGGDITYHGPGQIVGYPILDLEYFFTDLGRYMRSLEEAIIQTLAQYGINSDRLPGATGVWLEPNTPRARKICAMGVRCSRWVTMHGFALNVNTELSYFDRIVPCGISDKGVTSMEQELGKKVDMEAVKQLLKEAFGRIFNARLVTHAPQELPA